MIYESVFFSFGHLCNKLGMPCKDDGLIKNKAFQVCEHSMHRSIHIVTFIVDFYVTQTST